MRLIAGMLHLDYRAIKALRITDAYSIHRVVYSLYPRAEEGRILYADLGGDFRGRKVLLLSNREPSPCAEGGYGTVRVKPIPEGFLNHEHYRFRVVVNPVRRNKGKVVGVLHGNAMAEWFAQRAPDWGFHVSPERLQVGHVNVLRFRKSGHTVSVAQAEVQGVLQVLDQERFAYSFARGIGRGRGFGCGLLQIVPVV